MLLSDYPLTPKEAKEKGFEFYFSGKDCPRGHTSLRRVKNRECCECHLLTANIGARERYYKYHEYEKSSRRLHYLENKQAYLDSAKRDNPIRHAAMLKRIPPWANLDEIREFYRKCPPRYHVDHIFPLRGKTVSGLHVIGNLQYLTESRNKQKNNIFDQIRFPEQKVD